MSRDFNNQPIKSNHPVEACALGDFIGMSFPDKTFRLGRVCETGDTGPTHVEIAHGAVWSLAEVPANTRVYGLPEWNEMAAVLWQKARYDFKTYWNFTLECGKLRSKAKYAGKPPMALSAFRAVREERNETPASTLRPTTQNAQAAPPAQPKQDDSEAWHAHQAETARRLGHQADEVAKYDVFVMCGMTHAAAWNEANKIA